MTSWEAVRPRSKDKRGHDEEKTSAGMTWRGRVCVSPVERLFRSDAERGLAGDFGKAPGKAFAVRIDQSGGA
ncbi:MAG: hypothetical protein WB499_12305, partial [Pseudolabrys sp.]